MTDARGQIIIDDNF